MIQLPEQIKLPKERVLYQPYQRGNTDFFDKLGLKQSSIKELRKSIKKITITHALTPENTKIPEGEAVKQIVVISVLIEGEEVISSYIKTLDEHLPQYCLFVLRSNKKEEILINFKEPLTKEKGRRKFKIIRSFESSDQIDLNWNATDLDNFYKDLVKEVAADELVKTESKDIAQIIQKTDTLKKLDKKAEQAKKRMYSEKSMQKQMKWRDEYKSLLEEIKKLKGM